MSTARTPDGQPAWDTRDLDQGVAVGPTVSIDIVTPAYARDGVGPAHEAAVYWSDQTGTSWYVTEPTPDTDGPGIPDADIVDYLRRRASAYWALASEVRAIQAQLPPIGVAAPTATSEVAVQVLATAIAQPSDDGQRLTLDPEDTTLALAELQHEEEGR